MFRKIQTYMTKFLSIQLFWPEALAQKQGIMNAD